MPDRPALRKNHSVKKPAGNLRVAGNRQTDGSVANAKWLEKRSGPTLAIMQNDVALVAQIGKLKPIYKEDLPPDFVIPQVKNIRRIAAFHQETVHVFKKKSNGST